jgi:hypothetical protein
VLDDGLEEGLEVFARCPHRGGRHTLPGVRIQDRELDLVLGRVKVDEQVVNLIQDLLGPRIRTIDLVEDDDRRQTAFECLPQHEPRLGKRPLRRIHEQHDAVHHRQGPLNLTAKVRVSRGVDDVYEQVLVMDRGVLGQNCDSPFAFEVDAVHHTLGDLLVGPKCAALSQ